MAALSDVAWPRTTTRLTLRPCTPDDLEASWRIRSAPGVSEWLPYAATDRTAYAEKFLDPDRMDKVLMVEHDGEVIGDLMLRIQDSWAQAEVEASSLAQQAELGWSLHPDSSGQGFATEAVTELVRVCFEELGLRRVVAYCFADNTASWRLMERLGMRREQHTVGDARHRDGRWLDGYGYALLADEWHARVTSPTAGQLPD